MPLKTVPHRLDKKGWQPMAKDRNSGSEVRHSMYEIPTDVTTAGKWFDTFDTRNIVQAFAVTIFLVYLFTKVITVNLMFAIVVWIISIMFTLLSYGENHDTLYMYVYLVVRAAFIRRTYRRYVLVKKKRKVKESDLPAKIVRAGENSLKGASMSMNSAAYASAAAKEPANAVIKPHAKDGPAKDPPIKSSTPANSGRGAEQQMAQTAATPARQPARSATPHESKASSATSTELLTESVSYPAAPAMKTSDKADEHMPTALPKRPLNYFEAKKLMDDFMLSNTMPE